jgi:hypothetical protein
VILSVIRWFPPTHAFAHERQFGSLGHPVEPVFPRARVSVQTVNSSFVQDASRAGLVLVWKGIIQEFTDLEEGYDEDLEEGSD